MVNKSLTASQSCQEITRTAQPDQAISSARLLALVQSDTSAAGKARARIAASVSPAALQLSDLHTIRDRESKKRFTSALGRPAAQLGKSLKIPSERPISHSHFARYRRSRCRQAFACGATMNRRERHLIRSAYFEHGIHSHTQEVIARHELDRFDQ
jgi:hypothetical protein